MLRWIPLRWRRVGHGVHSPAAYAFIRNVIAEKYRYYDYERLSSALERLLYRIAVHTGADGLRLTGYPMPSTTPAGAGHTRRKALVFNLKDAQGREAYRQALTQTPTGWAFCHPGRIAIILLPEPGVLAPPLAVVRLRIL